MPRSSTSSISPEVLQELETQFYQFLDSLSFDEKKKFFSEFLTNEEKMMMYKRLALYWCLLEGYPLAKIQQMIGVTHDTTRVYNKKKNQLTQEFRELIGRIKGDEEEIKETPSESIESRTSYESESTVEESIPDTFEMPHLEAEEKPSEEAESASQTSESQHITPPEDFRIETREEHDYEEKKEEFSTPNLDTQNTSDETAENKEHENPFFGLQEEKPEPSPIIHSFEESQPTPAESAQNTEQSEQTPTQTQQTSNEEEPKEEKKKGWGKFFGF